MKKILSIITVFFLFFGLQAKSPETTKKVLVAYFSRVGNSSFSKNADAVTSASLRIGNTGFIGNTEVIAGIVQEAVAGDIFEIQTVAPYPGNYDAVVKQAKQEQESGYRPKLKTKIKNIESYDLIFIGYPIWWGTMPMSVFAFLEEYNFSGKTIVPFCTHEGSYLGRSVNDITKLCLHSTILDGLAVRGSDVKKAQKDVSAWLRKIKIMK